MDFKQLISDIVPIYPQLISEQTEENTIDYRQQLNLSLTVSQAEQNISTHLSLISSKINSQTSFTVKDLGFILETYLYTLFSISTISDLESTKLSNFYKRRKNIIVDYYQPIDPNYLEDILYTNYKPWGGKYGSLAYFLYLNKSYQHYQHPSKLSREITTYLIKSLPESEFTSTLLIDINSDELEADFEIYKSSYTLIQKLNFNILISQLTFYQTWIKDLLDWFSNVLNQGEIVNPHLPTSNAFKAFNLLVLIAQSLLRLGISFDESYNLLYQFFHQSISVSLIEGLGNIARLRKEYEFSIEGADLTKEEELCQSLFSSISLNLSTNFIKEETYRWLSIIQFPGGLNQWLVGISLELINRAYILCHFSNNTYSDYPLTPIPEKDIEFKQFLNRVYKLIFYAGFCLKKSDLDHLKILGFNLRTLSLLEEDSSFEEFNILI